MSAIKVRIGEADRPQPQLAWDSRWQPSRGVADWAIAAADEVGNIGGLAATQALHTAIVLALFTDKRVPDGHPHRKYIGGADPMGWWGNGVDLRDDLGEAELGSLIWIYQRAPLNEETRRFVEVAAQEALSPLIRQGAASRIDVQAAMFAAFGRIELYVQVYGRDGDKIFDVKFSDVWKQATAK